MNQNLTDILDSEIRVTGAITEQEYEQEQEQEGEVYVFPTSFAQQRLWFLDQFEPNSPFYNIPTAVRFKGPLNVSALEHSINEIVSRHETLRTTFASMEGKPVQIVHPGWSVPLQKIDLQSYAVEEREKEIFRLANEEARKPFDLTKGPLLRVTLVQADCEDHIVLLTMHHIISDGWSMGVLVREIATLYEAFSRGKANPLPELQIQYGDFAEWQQQHIAGEALEGQIKYWKEKLGGNPPVLELPADRPRPAVQTYRGENESLLIPKPIADGINALSRKESVTLFMSLLAAFQTLLYRYTGHEDICVGSPIANRTRSEIEDLIGFFVNTLVFRSEIAGEQSFRELLVQVRAATLEAYANQDVPFEKLVEVLQPDRDMSHSSLFQFMFILQNTPTRIDAKLPDVSLSTLDINAGTSTYDLTLMITEQPDGFLASAEYNTDLFDTGTIQRVLQHYQILLESIVAAPDEKLANLLILSADEKKKLLSDFQDYEQDYPKDICIHQLIEARAAEIPEALAVAFEGTYLTYDELNRRANRLAHRLQKLGVGPESFVGICIEKGPELIVAVLGTLKAGGAYIPIDPDYPQDRVAHMIEDAGLFVLLTQEKWLASLPSHQAHVICLDSNWQEIAAESEEAPSSQVTAQNLAYVIYTSGSTGKSKGTMISHASLANAYFAWEQEYRLCTEASSHLQMASFSFDVFSGDFVRALCSGGKLVLCPRYLLLDGSKLYQLMRREKVDCAEFVPAVLRNLIQYLEESGQDLSFMRVLIAGSDIWYVGEYQRFLDFCGSETRLINSFGLTEATIDSSYFEGSLASFPAERLVPIGRPFPNSKLYIFDKNLHLAPIGVPGELVVAGVNLARGYLRRPDLTAQKFIPNPFSNEPGARLYRTGDLARFLPDGNIEFLGRIDFQVKIRGYRIELGEIETALSKHPGVREAVVLAREDSPSDKRLVAYVVSDNGQATVADLRNFLKDQLPDYMVPSAYVFLEALPLTPNRKVDRRALPAPDRKDLVLLTTYVAPFTPTQEVIAGIWGKILGKERIGAHDNFFELGGHSLLATQVISRIRESFKIEFPLRSIFELPTVAELARAVDQAMLAKDGIHIPAFEVISCVSELPLSFAQQRLWFLDQLEPNSPFYNIPEGVRISGPLDAAVLESCLQEIVKRHESLRTTFRSIDGRPVQNIVPDLCLPIRKVDLTLLPTDERTEELHRIAMESAQQPFDLSTGPLLRVILVRLDEHDHAILMTMHHIISDDWSSSVLIQELAILYGAFTQGMPSPLPELKFQYADFAAWQQKYLHGEVLDAQMEYWKKKLSGAPPLLALPTDRPRPAMPSFKGSYQTFEWPEQLSAAITELGKVHGATLFMTLLAAWQTLLYRYSGEEDISVGSPIANRTQQETERIIGFFVNTLVLRTDLSGAPSFVELLRRVRETALGAYAHQDVPFEKLVDSLQPERNLSHSPLFQVMFAMQNTPKQEFSVSELTMSALEAHSGTAKFDLTLFMLEEEGKLAGALEYSSDLFDDATITRMLGHFQRLMESIVANPEQHVSRLSLLTGEQQQKMLVSWNDTETDYLPHQPVHALFSKQVAQTPDAVAVTCGGDKLTYDQLNRRANQLAHHLQKLGVGPDILVGIHLPRSLDMMVALLATLKAGGAYVPLDPSYPPDRLTYMMKDSSITVLLTHQNLISDFGFPISDYQRQPATCDLPLATCNLQHVVCLDSEWESIESESCEDPLVEVDPANLAYIIYTSGSTGKPKGTLITHAGLTNYLDWCLKTYPLLQGRGSLVHSTLAFDATVTGLFAPLICGNTTHLLSESEDIEALSRMIQSESDFSLIKITPAHLQMLGHLLSPAQAKSAARAFVIGGENLVADHVAFWQEHAAETLLINEYGPTETVVGCMNYVIPSDRREPGSEPIGFPIQNMRIYILDGEMQPVPIGVSGEMYIGGVGVARGYLNRPDLTAEKFVPDPFSQQPGARLYRTGDLAKHLPDGNMEFLGRIDHQVKIRGFRIELGEIEDVLGRHPALREVAVVARRNGAASVDLRLVAYVVPKDDEIPTIAELRAFLKNELPEYMIPSVFVRLDAFPLTVNGKVDRKALPDPGETRTILHEEFVAPRTQVEELLADIIGKILGLDQVSITDNFFAIGGHSLLATQLISRIDDVFNVQLPLRVIFEAPTVAELSMRIGQGSADTAVVAPPVKALPRGERTAFPASFSQQRLWFLDQLQPGNTHFNIPAAIRLTGALKVDVLEQSLNAVMQRHESLRTTFATENSEPIQVVSDDVVWDLPKVDLRELDAVRKNSEANRLQIEEAQKPFDLARGPLVRATLLTLDENEHIVILTMHHIVSDAWSMGVLIREVATIYHALSSGQLPELSDLPIQYPDFSAWQREWLQGEVLDAELGYWKNQLAGSPPVLDLPLDRPRPPVKTFSGDYRTFEIAPELTLALKDLSRQNGATLFMTLMAAFKALLHRYSGQDDITVGTPIANRNCLETEGLIGFFVNTLALRTDLSGEPSFVELLRRVRETALQAYTHQDVPFEKLVEVLQPERDLSHTPLFQVMFVLQNAPMPAVELSGLTISTMSIDSTTVLYDLVLSMQEEGDHLSATLEYNTDLFNASTIERMVGHFQSLLKAIGQTPEQSLLALPMLTAHERKQVLVQWNDTATETVLDRCIHRIFEEQVEKTPDAIALSFGEIDLSYQELNRRANQLARYLQRLGVGPDVLVGLSVDRSLEMVVGILGIMKAGGAYVPLDPAYPKARLLSMVEDAHLHILLTQEALAKEVWDKERLVEEGAETSRIGNRQIISLDSQWPKIAQEAEENPVSNVTPQNLVYVIFTSGSTGRPKGVMIPHQGLVNLTADQIPDFGVDANSRVLQFASFSFDASASEIFMALLTGARLYLAPREILMSPPDLMAFFQREKITTVTLPPSVLRVLQDEEAPYPKSIISAGESCSKKIAVKWSKNRALINAYGPTEASIGVSSFQVDHIPEKGASIPIGRPIANDQLFLLDRSMNPVPIGVAGELYVGGAGLARGYLHRPDLTAEKFVPNPFAKLPGERLYRTGDLARFHEDGNIEYLGRIDHQVKIRGFRIELGEVESVLLQHPDVQEAVIITRPAHQDGRDSRLIGYVVLDKEREEVGINDLRNYLRERLPEYMVPSAFVILPEMPMAPNGKIDRKALPEPDKDAAHAERPYVAPRTQEEKIIAGIWEQILGIERVGALDNFFDLGGHSLLATQISSRAKEAFNVQVPLATIFETPTLAEFAQQISLLMRETHKMQLPPLLPVSRDEALPLSFAQQRLWFLDQLEPGTPLYNLPTAVRLRGYLDIDLLKESLQRVIQRHEILRTSFAAENGKPHQVIHPVEEIELPVMDLRNLEVKAREQKALQVAMEESLLIFNLSIGPLLRFRLLRLAEEESVFLLTMHHIISDGWSMRIFVEEVAKQYQALRTGESAFEQPLDIQYADFAHWQRLWLQGETLAAQLSYWKQKLAGSPELITLPTDRPRPAVQSFRGKTQSFALPKELSDAVAALNRYEGVTMFMTLMAAFQVLLQRYSGQDDICVGTPIANRHHLALEQLIGFFVNTLVMRADFSYPLTFRQLLKQVRRTALDAYAHQDLPFEMLVDAMKPARDMSHSPLFQVVLALQNAPLPDQKVADLQIVPIEFESGLAKFDLTMTMMETENGLVGSLEYNTDLFDDRTINRMIEHFSQLLTRMLADPDQLISEVSILPQGEEGTLLKEWNDTAVEFLSESCIHELFEAQVTRTPDALAVTLDGDSLTYRELNVRANKLGHYLQKLGVGSESKVGILVERSLNMVVGLMGVLKAGGAYVPLDPTYPQERLSFMLKDSAVSVLLTHADLIEDLEIRIEDFADLTVLCLDADWDNIDRESGENLVNTTTADNLAYIIYTSGSTGRPKGTLLQHRGSCNLISAYARELNIRPGSHVLQFFSFAIDGSVADIFSALVSGATLHLVRRNSVISALDLYDVFKDQAITHALITPSMLKVIPSENLPALQYLIAGGERCTDQIVERWAHGRNFFNAYGPTEATVAVAWYRVVASADVGINIPIGRPIANTQLYILDKQLQSVPIGVTGELHIGGVGLARGYLNRPDLTADRFIPDPFSSEPGGRLYKTGDLVRYRQDGNIEYLGRIDNQVKVRRFRIELEEIEAVIGQQPQVRECAVVVREDKPGDKRIVAYYSTPHGAEITDNDLRALAREKLPDYMVPSIFMRVETFPLTENGKVNRRALPMPELDRSDLEAQHVVPRTAKEETLAEIWQQVLGVKKAGIRDNFFDLGGDSILTMQVIALANQAGIKISPRQIFMHPTIEELAAAATSAEPGHAEQGMVIGSVPLTPVQNWFFEHQPIEPHHFNTSMMLEFFIKPQIPLLEQVANRLLPHHDSLRMQFRRTDSKWEGFLGDAKQKVPFYHVDLSQVIKREKKEAIESVASSLHASLDFSEKPLIRMAYFDLGAKENPRLLIIFHHLIIDGVSWRLFIQDFVTSYRQLSRGEEISLPAKTTSFQSWAKRLRDYSQSALLREQLSYWFEISKHRLSSLPRDFPDGKNTFGSAEEVTLSLPTKDTRALLQKVLKAKDTRINDVLLTALGRILSQWTGEQSFLIEMEGHGREDIFDDIDLSRTIGWFTTIFPVLLKVDQGEDLENQLASVTEQLQRIPQNGFGYGLLRYFSQDASVKAQVEKLPEPEVNFNYLGQFDQLPEGEQVPFRVATESVGLEQSPSATRSALLYVVGIVSGGQLHIRWLYSNNVHRRSTIEKLAKNYMKELRRLISEFL